MRFSDKVKLNSVTYFVSSILIRWVYNLASFFYHGFSDVQKSILHLALAIASLVLGWLALQLYRKSKPSGSNLGCTYLVLLLINLVGGAGAVFFALVGFFSEEGSSDQTLWLL